MVGQQTLDLFILVRIQVRQPVWAMKTLKDISIVLYLAVDPKALKTRIEASTRGIVGLKSKSFEDLYSERENLYMKHADFVIDANNKSPEQLAQEIAILIIPRSVEMIE